MKKVIIFKYNTNSNQDDQLSDKLLPKSDSMILAEWIESEVGKNAMSELDDQNGIYRCLSVISFT